MFKFETISETISRLLYIGIEKQRVQHFFCTKFLNKSGARSAYTEWLIPLECLASTFLPLLSLPGTLSFGTGWRSTTSLTRCLMSAHLRASRQVDPHLYPDLGVWIQTWMHPSRVANVTRMLERVPFFHTWKTYYFVSCESRNNRWNMFICIFINWYLYLYR